MESIDEKRQRIAAMMKEEGSGVVKSAVKSIEILATEKKKDTRTAQPRDICLLTEMVSGAAAS